MNNNQQTRQQNIFQYDNTPVFNTNTSHPLIPNSQEFIYYRKYVSIHSEDRNILKYPESSDFEFELPEDLCNVATLRLSSWTFPANYNTFSILNGNITMSFQINKPYNPGEFNYTDPLYNKIFECLYYNIGKDFNVVIEQGFYNPEQMVTELTNKFNSVVSILLITYFNTKSTDTDLSPQQQEEYKTALELLQQQGGYNNFVIVYNNVSQKIWFGNTTDAFILTNETQFKKNELLVNYICENRSLNPDFSDWGLPGNLGLVRCNTPSINGSSISNFTEISIINGDIVPRFFFGDVFPGDSGYWLVPNTNLPGSQVNWVEASYKINLMGPAFIYMELDGQNCLDETCPYNSSIYTNTSSGTNGIVNSAFAKIPIPTTPISQWFDRESLPYKFYYPPAERMKKFRVFLRYHNGQKANFGVFNYSFVLEFVLQLPQILRTNKGESYPPIVNIGSSINKRI
uniref:Uncharacterized protein n=1 Tax=viral metagenome TaxID=1070528 RepID=A0A6C0AQX5_9ZZZZ